MGKKGSLLLLLFLALATAVSSRPRFGQPTCTYSPHDQNNSQSILTVDVPVQDYLKGDSLLHIKLKLLPDRPTEFQSYGASDDTGPPMMQRFYLYAYRYASNANLIAVQMPEAHSLETLPYTQIRRMNEPQMESLLRSALGRAAGEILLNDAFDQSTQAWAQAPSITAEGFRQRLRPGMIFNVRASLQGAGAAVRYNVMGLSISTAYSSQNEGLDPVRVALPFSSDWNRGEFGVDTQGNLWLNFVGRW